MDSADENPDIEGKSFENRYKLGELLGKGATSSAYKAQDILLQRDVVVKIIHAHLITSQDAIQRFKKEAALCSSLSHPAIARIYNSGVSLDGRLYIVMDYLSGKTLATILKDEGKLSFPDFFLYFKQLLAGIEHAHEHNIVHRDIKPSNIIICSDNEIKNAVLIDFGLAKSIDADSQSSTKTGLLMGSAAYMSPEQCRGDKQIDQRSDIYSFGSVMAESLLGSAPFTGGSELEIMSKHLEITEKRLGFLKRLPQSLSKIIRKCLEKDPNNRYANAAELRNELTACSRLDDFSVAATATPQRVRKLIAFLGLLVICGLFTYFILKKDSVPAQVVTSVAEHKRSYKQPIKIEDLKDCVDRINQEAKGINRDADKALAEINSWERHYGKSSDKYDRQCAESLKVRQYCFLEKEKEAKRVVDLLLGKAPFDPASEAVYAYMTRLVDIRNYDEAISLLQKFEKSYPELKFFPDKQGLLYKKLADCYYGKCEFKQAKANFERAHAAAVLSDKTYMVNDDGIGGVRGLLITCCVLKDDAEIERLIDWVKKYFGANSRTVALAEFSMARVLLQQGYGTRAESLLCEAKEGFRRLGDMKDVKDCDRALSNYFLGVRRYRESLECEKEYYSLALSDHDRIASLTNSSACFYALNDRKMEKTQSDEALAMAEKILSNYVEGRSEFGIIECENSYRTAMERKIAIFVEDMQYTNAVTIANAALKKYGKTFPEIGLFLYRKIHFLKRILNCVDDAELKFAISGIEELIPEIKRHSRSPEQAFSLLDAQVEVARLKEELFSSQKKYEDAADEAKRCIALVRENISGENFFVEQTLAYCYYLTELKKNAELRAFLQENRKLWMRLKFDSVVDWLNKMKHFADLEFSVRNYDEAEQVLLTGLRTIEQSSERNPWSRFKFYEALAQVYSKLGKTKKYDECLSQLRSISKSQIVEEDVISTLDFIMLDFGHFHNRELAETCIKLVQSAAPPTVVALCPLRISLLYMANNELDQRIKWLKRSLEVNKSSSFPMRVFYCDVSFELGAAYSQNNQLDEAVKCMDEVKSVARDLPLSNDITGRQMKLARAESYLGSIDAVRKDYPRSLKHFETALDEFEKVGPASKGLWTDSLGKAISIARVAKDDNAVARLTARAKKGLPEF